MTDTWTVAMKQVLRGSIVSRMPKLKAAKGGVYDFMKKNSHSINIRFVEVSFQTSEHERLFNIKVFTIYNGYCRIVLQIILEYPNKENYT